MPANVENMMYVREKPWHGLGTMVTDAPASADALRFAGMDWQVIQEPVYNARGGVVKGYKANVRDSDGSVLGIVGDRYKVVQNADAFSFTDDLIGDDVRYETAGSLRDGRQVWLLARMPERKVAGDEVEPYKSENGPRKYRFLVMIGEGDGFDGLPVRLRTRLKTSLHRSVYVELAYYKDGKGVVRECSYYDRGTRVRTSRSPRRRW